MGALVVAIANCKGGVGKTTTAVNLAAELARTERRVLLVDLDSQGQSGMGFGVSTTRPSETAHEVFRRAGVDLSLSLRKTRFERLQILPADCGFSIHQATDAPHRLAQALDPLKDRYDVILIDTAPAADLPLVAALTAARCVLIPTQLTHLAHDGLVKFSRVFFKVATSLNQNLAAFAIVPIQMDMRTHIQQIVLAKLLMDFGTQRIFRGIRTDIALAEAFGEGRPVGCHRPSCRGAKDYVLLAQQVSKFWNC